MEQAEETLAALLKEKKMSVTVAESCTGGMIAAKLVNVPGISEFFWGSFVTYANEAKTALLEVDEQLLAKRGGGQPGSGRGDGSGCSEDCRCRCGNFQYRNRRS